MKKIRLIFSIILFAAVYMSFCNTSPWALRIRNEALYYINHNSDIRYIADNAVYNTKNLISYIKRAGE